MASAFLTTYRPICGTRTGRIAVERFGLSPFIDGSCRREPDFESAKPAITALCRGANFVPRLKLGDRVAYITKRGSYLEDAESHWRLVALLTVIDECTDHEHAARWYREHGLPMSRNLIVEGNPPQPYEKTDGVVPSQLRSMRSQPEQLVRLWDAAYRNRARKCSLVRVCEPTFLELDTPPAIYERDWNEWLGRVPMTRNPPRIDEELWMRLTERTASR